MTDAATGPARPIAGRFASAPLAFALTTLLIGWLPAAGAALQIDRARLLDGELWRALTGHLTHWHDGHLLTNVLAAAALALLFRHLPNRFWVVTGAGAALAVTAGLLIEPVPLERYRGLSGVLYGWLFVALLYVARDAHTPARRRALQGLALAPPLLALADLAGLGGALRTTVAQVPVHPAAHLYGMAGAMLADWCYHRPR